MARRPRKRRGESFEGVEAQGVVAGKIPPPESYAGGQDNPPRRPPPVSEPITDAGWMAHAAAQRTPDPSTWSQDANLAHWTAVETAARQRQLRAGIMAMDPAGPENVAVSAEPASTAPTTEGLAPTGVAGGFPSALPALKGVSAEAGAGEIVGVSVIVPPQEQPPQSTGSNVSLSGAMHIGASSMAGAGGLTANAEVHPAAAAIGRNLAASVIDNRRAAQGLLEATQAKIAELRDARSNDADLIDFLEWLASGLSNLVEYLDRAIAQPGSEPMFLGWRAKLPVIY